MIGETGAFIPGHFWVLQPWRVRMMICVGAVMTLIAALRLARVAFQLLRKVNLPQGMEEGTAGSFEIATFALAKRNLGKLALDVTRSQGEVSSTKDMLREADVRFNYLWENCWTDLRSAKNTALLFVLLSLLGASFQAIGALFEEWGRQSATQFFMMAGFEMVAWLRFGFQVAALLYFLSSFLERKLRHRRTEWAYFCARLGARNLPPTHGV